MKFKRQVEIVKGRPDLTALVNVVLLLLFFFLLGSSFVQQPGIEVDLPRSRQIGTLPRKNNLVVMITAAEEAYFQDTKMSLQELHTRLAREAERSTDQQVVIESDSKVPYKTIVEVMDMVSQFRFRSLSLATRAESAASPSEK